MTAYFQAFLDDLYALDASRRAKDSVRYRKGKGVSIGLPPFGTIRDDNGFLIPSPEGAWLMPDGKRKRGKDPNKPPHPDAVWRGYYDCARRILEIYKEDLHGYLAIAKQLNQDGWAFRDRWGDPRPLTMDDVRRVTSNWREYAGLVQHGRARERVASRIESPSSALYDTGRAVFELDLLYAVAKVQEARSIVTRPSGTVQSAHVFALSHLLYCARCEAEAQNEDNPKLRSRIIGWQKQGKLRYRHSSSRICGRHIASVFTHVIEDDFARLVDVLNVHPDGVSLMADIAVQSQFNGLGSEANETDLEAQKQVAIAKHRHALKNNLTLFQNGEIDADEYYRQKDHHERQMAHWEARTTDRQKVLFELTTSLEMVKRLKQFWDISQGDDRKLLAHSLFDEIVYDLDARRIVDFKVKQWAEPFLIMRAALYADQMGEEMKNRFNSGVSSEVSFHEHYRIQSEHLQDVNPHIAFLQAITFPQSALAERFSNHI